ncbi:MAG: cytochrome c oxidase subunit II [bacterium]
MIGILQAMAPEGLLASAGGSFWLPAAKSTFAKSTDATFYFIYWLSVFFFVLILVMAVWFLLKYRRKGPVPQSQPSAHHSTFLELLWSGVPLLLVLGIFVMGFRGFMDLRTPPKGAYEVRVIGQKWNWAFQYPNGYEDSELHVPAGEPIRLVMTSMDVLHSFYVPEFRVKMDVVPGRYTDAWFQADDPGESRIFCAEYCGTSHSQMLSKVIVHEKGEFDEWMKKAADWISEMAPEEAGAILYDRKGCRQCHSLDGTGGVGPTFKGSFGNRRAWSDGSSGVMDENYIRESILNPKAKVVAGFDPVMPTFQGRVNEKELAALIAYIKSLK